MDMLRQRFIFVFFDDIPSLKIFFKFFVVYFPHVNLQQIGTSGGLRDSKQVNSSFIECSIHSTLCHIEAIKKKTLVGTKLTPDDDLKLKLAGKISKS